MHREKLNNLLHRYKSKLVGQDCSSEQLVTSQKVVNAAEPSQSSKILLGLDISDELKKIDKVIDFVNEYPNCFERTNSIGHITGSAWLLNPSMDKALLMHHKKLNMWLQLGGHADGDGDILQVSLKEAEEESGIEDIVPLSGDIFDLDIHWVDHKCPHGFHYHFDIRFLLKANTENYVQNHESLGLKWHTFSEIINSNYDAGVKRLAYKWSINT